LDDEQHRHPWHSSNGSYDDIDSSAAVVVVVVVVAGRTYDDDGRYTTLFTGTYSSSAGDADGLLLDCFSSVPPACSFHGQGIIRNESRTHAYEDPAEQP
jgi:hypothetical protein